MISLEDLKLYLPKYLSSESQKELFKELQAFPGNMDSRLFSTKLIDEETIFQGDGIGDLLVVNFPESRIGVAKGMVLSNTCDIDHSNKRMFPSRICYVPIFSLEKYETGLLDSGFYSAAQVVDHVNAVKTQKISQIFFLPKASEKLPESIVFLDRINNCDNNCVDRSDLGSRRIFTLSDYGLYLFLFKLSIHFTRVQESVERGAA